VVDKLNSHGFEAYIVGGCLRDLMLDREIND
jgi:tRNA nucleotidyltransferase/poly(A) polymerase